jgi:uncharacterized protein
LHTHHLIFFTRFPEAGTTKTRLIPRLGREGAAQLQRRMTEHIFSQLLSVHTSRKLVLEIHYEGGDERRMREWLGSAVQYKPQGSGDIGERMGLAFEDAFKRGAESVVIIGSDIPEITGAIIEKAFFALNHRDLILGPASDGGYYLIGLRKTGAADAVPALFEEIPWGTDTVLSETVRRAEGLHLRHLFLPQLTDVDRPEDLPVWEHASDVVKKEGGPDTISVIIPAINEVNRIEGAIGSARLGNPGEILVADGGSTDGSGSLVESLGARVIQSAPPRSNQLNHGAFEATGDVLLFLHADTLLPDNYHAPVLELLKSPSVSAGAFRLSIDSPLGGLRRIAFMANLRSRFLSLPYGDQAIFCRSSIFYGAGGFPDLPIMDDFELMRKLKTRGKIATLAESVSTSSRRWENRGILKTTLINQVVIMLYFMGISPQVIARLYRRGRGV